MPKARVVVARRRKNLSLKTKKTKKRKHNRGEILQGAGPHDKPHHRPNSAAAGGKLRAATGLQGRPGVRSPAVLPGGGGGGVPAGEARGDAEARRILAMPKLACPDFLTDFLTRRAARPTREQAALMGKLLPPGRKLKWRGMFGRAPPARDAGLGPGGRGREDDEDDEDDDDEEEEGNGYALDVDGEGGRLGLSADGFGKLEKFGFGHLHWNGLFAGSSRLAARERSAPSEPRAQDGGGRGRGRMSSGRKELAVILVS